MRQPRRPQPVSVALADPNLASTARKRAQLTYLVRCALPEGVEKQRTFSLFEGGFFGNLFTPRPVTYTCRGARPPDQAQEPVWRERICTREAGATTADGRPMTACHLMVTRPCAEDGRVTVDGQPYAKVIFTCLRPRKHR
jgi:hypothetical protein